MHQDPSDSTDNLEILYETLPEDFKVWEVTLPTSIDDLIYHVVARSEEEVWKIVEKEDLKSKAWDPKGKNPTVYATTIKRLDYWSCGLFVVRS